MPEGTVLPEGSLINNRYRIIGLIGGGAMSHVYKVEHIQWGTFHAMKQLCNNNPHENALFEATLEIARREARFLKNLSHPSLPKVTDFIHEDFSIFIIMDYVEGENLKMLLEANGGHALEIMTVLRWGVQICDILTYLHNQDPPIIFRDIKPANLICKPNDEISLVDFGIAREVRDGAVADTIVFGSPGYAPPEQYGKGQTSARSDIYAFGATLHHLLTGRDPSPTPFKWPSVRTLNPEVPLVLDKLIMKCLEMEAVRRPENMEAVRRGLHTTLQMMEEASAIPSPASPTTPLPDSGSRRLSPLALPNAVEPVGSATIPISPEVLDMINATTPSDRPAFIPAGYSQPREREYISETTSDSKRLRTRQPSTTLRSLYRVLSVCAILILIVGVLFPFLGGMLSPHVPSVPVAPGPTATLDSQTAYQESLTRYEQAQHALSIYENLTMMRYTLDFLVCLALFFGAIRPMRPTRIGMVLTIGGILALLCLTGATFLPDRIGIFLGLALVESLMLVPAAVLCTTEIPS